MKELEFVLFTILLAGGGIGLSIGIGLLCNISMWFIFLNLLLIPYALLIKKLCGIIVEKWEEK